MTTYKITPLKKPVTAKLAIPGSKSYTNRALLLAAMTPGSTRVAAPLVSDDTEAMIDCLQTLGLAITRTNDVVTVTNDIQSIEDREYVLNANLSGTTIRFLLALTCVIPGTQIITGEHGLLQRPIGDMVDALKAAGADIAYIDKEGFPPLRVASTQLNASELHINGSVSSQYVSALLMIAPLAKANAVIVDGELISKPYVTMTLDTMRQFGVEVINKDNSVYHIPKNSMYSARSYRVEGDVSSASYFAAISVLTGSTVTLTNMNPQSAQADMQFIKLLEQMGGKLSYSDNSITIKGSGETIEPFNVDMESCPDQAMTMAVLAAFANGASTLSGIRSLRVKETERVVALEQELAKMGITTSSTNDTLTIHGGNPQPATISTYGDHRMAMAFAVAGSKLAGMRINDPNVVSKTFPNFWEKLGEMGIAAQSLPTNIALIGMRGSGKTTVSRLLGKRLEREIIDVDENVVIKAGKTISEIVEQDGWEVFRDHETTATIAAAARRHTIISTGGGVVLRPENITALKQSSLIVFLQADTTVLERRIKNSADRPALTSQQTFRAELTQIASERQRKYEQAADAIIATDNLEPEAIAQKIITFIKEQGV